MELESELTSVELFVAFSQNEAMYSCFQQDDTPVTAKNDVSEHLLEIRFHKVKSLLFTGSLGGSLGTVRSIPL